MLSPKATEEALLRDQRRHERLWSLGDEDDTLDEEGERDELVVPRNPGANLMRSTKRLMNARRMMRFAGARGVQAEHIVGVLAKTRPVVSDKAEQEFVTKVLTSVPVMMMSSSMLKYYKQQCLDPVSAYCTAGGSSSSTSTPAPDSSTKSDKVDQLMSFMMKAGYDGADAAEDDSYGECRSEKRGSNEVYDEWQTRSFAAAASFIHQMKVGLAQVCWQELVRPALDEAAEVREKYTALKRQFHEARSEYLKEVVALRDHVRVRGDPEGCLTGKSLDVAAFFEPTHMLEPAELQFTLKVLQEKLKMIFEANPTVSSAVDFGQLERLKELVSCHEIQQLQTKLGQKVSELKELKRIYGIEKTQQAAMGMKRASTYQNGDEEGAGAMLEASFKSMEVELSHLRAKHQEDQRVLHKKQSLIEALKGDQAQALEDLEKTQDECQVMRRMSIQLTEEVETLRKKEQELLEAVPQAAVSFGSSQSSKRRRSQISQSIDEKTEAFGDDDLSLTEQPRERVLQLQPVKQANDVVNEVLLPKTAEQEKVAALAHDLVEQIQSYLEPLLSSTDQEVLVELHKITRMSADVDDEATTSVARVRELEEECLRLQEDLQKQAHSLLLMKAEATLDQADMLAEVMHSFQDGEYKEDHRQCREQDGAGDSRVSAQVAETQDMISCEGDTVEQRHSYASSRSYLRPSSQEESRMAAESHKAAEHQECNSARVATSELETGVQALRAGMGDEITRLRVEINTSASISTQKQSLASSVASVVDATERVFNMHNEQLAAELALVMRQVEDVRQACSKTRAKTITMSPDNVSQQSSQPGQLVCTCGASPHANKALEQAEKMLTVLTAKLQKVASDNVQLQEMVYSMNTKMHQTTTTLEKIPELSQNAHLQQCIRNMKGWTMPNLPNVFDRLWKDATRRNHKDASKGAIRPDGPSEVGAVPHGRHSVSAEPAPEPLTSAEDAAPTDVFQRAAFQQLEFPKQDLPNACVSNAVSGDLGSSLEQKAVPSLIICELPSLPVPSLPSPARRLSAHRPSPMRTHSGCNVDSTKQIASAGHRSPYDDTVVHSTSSLQEVDLKRTATLDVASPLPAPPAPPVDQKILHVRRGSTGISNAGFRRKPSIVETHFIPDPQAQLVLVGQGTSPTSPAELKPTISPPQMPPSPREQQLAARHRRAQKSSDAKAAAFASATAKLSPPGKSTGVLPELPASARDPSGRGGAVDAVPQCHSPHSAVRENHLPALGQ